MLDGQDETDGKLEPPSGSDDEKQTSIDPEDNMNKNEASSLVDNTHASSLVQYRSVHELETILIFDLCALSEIATSKSAILRVRLRPCSWAFKEFSFLLKLVFILLGCECYYYANVKVMDFILKVTQTVWYRSATSTW